MTANDITDIFTQDNFNVESADIGRGNAFVRFYRGEDAARAAEEYNGAQLNNGFIKVRVMTNEGGPVVHVGGGAITVVKRGDGGSGVTIKVSNLPSGLTEGDLKEIFASIGSVSSSFIKGGARGAFGLVTFEGQRAQQLAERAVSEFDRAQINGTEISVALDAGAPPRAHAGARW